MNVKGADTALRLANYPAARLTDEA